MKSFSAISLLLLATLLTGCEVIGDIFGAGVYVGVFISVLVVAAIIWVIAKVFKGKN